MHSCMSKIKNLLKNYLFYKMQVESGLASEKLSEQIRLLESCICVLDEQSYNLIKAVFIDKIKIVAIAKANYCSRQTIYYRRDCIIKNIASVLKDRL